VYFGPIFRVSTFWIYSGELSGGLCPHPTPASASGIAAVSGWFTGESPLERKGGFWKTRRRQVSTSPTLGVGDVDTCLPRLDHRPDTMGHDRT
jgi:hypothetical protein